MIPPTHLLNHLVYNGIVFVGGQTADDRSQDIRGQTKLTLAKTEKFLADAGTDKSRLLSVQIRNPGAVTPELTVCQPPARIPAG
jgi:enamine deaminase RidA (YjgF/YER057c/UK114 family)